METPPPGFFNGPRGDLHRIGQVQSIRISTVRTWRLRRKYEVTLEFVISPTLTWCFPTYRKAAEYRDQLAATLFQARDR